MLGSSESWGPQQHPHPWHFRAGGGAVHSIKSGLTRRSKKELLFDHLVGAGEQRRGHVKTKCLRAFQIDYQLVFGGPRHGKVGRLLTLENAVDVISCVDGLTDDFRSLRDQAADGNEVSRCEDRTSEREARQAGE